MSQVPKSPLDEETVSFSSFVFCFKTRKSGNSLQLYEGRAEKFLIKNYVYYSSQGEGNLIRDSVLSLGCLPTQENNVQARLLHEKDNESIATRQSGYQVTQVELHRSIQTPPAPVPDFSGKSQRGTDLIIDQIACEER
jgi:hypothetical protein